MTIPESGSAARLEFTKWGGTPHWHYDMRVLGTDSFGTWFGAHRGAEIQRGDEPPIQWPCDFVVLVPTAGTWVATFNAAGATELYIDITGPVSYDGTTIRADDLDLDVVRTRAGEVRLLDEDEFELHQRVYGYPADVVGAARASAAHLMREVSAGAEPFATRGSVWLAELGELAR